MTFDTPPFFRRAIIPWYDSNVVCAVLILLFLAVFAFSVIGIRTALFMKSGSTVLWVPSLLGGLSFFLVMRILIRLLNRKKNS